MVIKSRSPWAFHSIEKRHEFKINSYIYKTKAEEPPEQMGDFRK